jgi:hypothetical protein
MSIEAGVVLDKKGECLHWHLPQGRSVAYLPDSRLLWWVFWDLRHRLSGFAHSHPSGVYYPSHEDLTTFAAVEAGLGMRLDWWIVSDDKVTLSHWVEGEYRTVFVALRPEWVDQLKERSTDWSTGE